jgi:deoxyribodipyrimidine photolyase-related protein
MKVLLILPTQLFKENPLIKLVDKVYLVEEPFYFTRYAFHKMKLTYHRATMKHYYDHIGANKYVEFDKVHYPTIFKNVSEVYLYDPVDTPVLDTIYKHAKDIEVRVYDTPAFMETREDLEEYRNKHTNKKNYFHDASFYRYQRRRLNVLMNGDKPVGGKWSYDKENRNPYDDAYEEPAPKTYDDKYIKEARSYVNARFPKNFGTNDVMYYPVTFKDAEQHLKKFLKHNIHLFGKYQDGVRSDVVFGTHSILSPMLNIGLLTPGHVLSETMKHYDKKHIAAYEAFIRQLIGWRSFMRFVYVYHGKDMLKMNYLHHQNKVTKAWYEATTGIPTVDSLIAKVKQYAYLHHIERLMYMGNFALLTLIHPKEVYKWFMICFIDAYEWVMVPNVMGMSQYSLKGISMMTRPYFSSSNYITKMSDYDKDDTWDALYYHFISKHEKVLSKIYATAMQVKHWVRMSGEMKKGLLGRAKRYLNYTF